MTEQGSTAPGLKRPILYPTLVIGLGGVGTEVVRHVKRRFQRMWDAADPDLTTSVGDELPNILQLLAVDTEPLNNPSGKEYLQQHECAFLGNFDATRLIGNLSHHREINQWWYYPDLPLGYIHNGARQLRPLGRLAFFRNYVTFKEKLSGKLSSIMNIRDQELAQLRGFSVVLNYPLVFIVSSVCGGTGSGMLLDVAHWVKDKMGAKGQVAGMLLMPSAFDNTIRSNLQRRRIRANAYAALKEINACQVQAYPFHVLYPSERAPIPHTARRPFDSLYLIERTNRRGRSLTSKQDVEHMVAHMIELMSNSHMSERILGLDVNIIHETPKAFLGDVPDAGQAVRYEATEKPEVRERREKVWGTAVFSSFGVSALTMPREALARYCSLRTLEDAAYALLYGPYQDDQDPGLLQQIEADGKALRELLRTELRRVTTGFEAADMHERLAGAESVLKQKMREGISQEIRSAGLWGAIQLCEFVRQTLSVKGLTGFTQQQIREQRRAVQGRTGLLSRIVDLVESIFAPRRAERDAAAQEQVDRRQRAQIALGEGGQALVQSLNVAAEEAQRQIGAWSGVVESLINELFFKSDEMARRDFDPHRYFPDEPSVSTVYDLETSATYPAFGDLLWRELESSTESESPGVIAEFKSGIIDRCLSLVDASAAEPGTADELLFAMQEYLDEQQAQLVFEGLVGKVLEIKKAVRAQQAEASSMGLPDAVDNRFRQAFDRVDPFCPTDFDAHPFNEADLEQIKLVSVPADKADQDKELAEMLRDYRDFDWVSRGDDASRMDICWMLHGLPLWSIFDLNELYEMYCGSEFAGTTHVLPTIRRTGRDSTPGPDSDSKMPELLLHAEETGLSVAHPGSIIDSAHQASPETLDAIPDRDSLAPGPPTEEDSSGPFG